MLVGYSRVSSTGQNLTSQIEALEEAGCERVYKEKKSGTNVSARPILEEAIDFCRAGDVFLVTRLDRCSRSVGDLQDIIKRLDEKGVGFKCTEQSEVDTTTSNGRLMLNLLSAFAQFETELRAERQKDGVQSALARGVKFGKKSADLSEETIKSAIARKEAGETSQSVADSIGTKGISRSTLLKYIKAYKESQ